MEQFGHMREITAIGLRIKRHYSLFKRRLIQMKLTLLFILLFVTQSAFGQFGIIHDNDGFVFIHKAAISNNNIVDTLSDGQVVYCLWPKNGYYEVDYETDHKLHSGYVHKSRIQFISKLDSLQPLEQTINKVIFQKDSLKVTFKQIPFVVKNNKLEYGKGDQYSFLEKINGKEYWGSDGGIPKTQYGQVSIMWGDKKIDLPKEMLDDLFNPNFEHRYTTVNFDKTHNSMYIIGQNGDGAGGYAVLWIIENGKYKGRFVTHGF